MFDRLGLLISGGLTGTSIVTLLGLLVRAFPPLSMWAYIIAGVSALTFGILLATKRPDVIFWVTVVSFFSVLGVVFAGV